MAGVYVISVLVHLLRPVKRPLHLSPPLNTPCLSFTLLFQVECSYYDC
jgi:hypothetical protein